GVRRVAVLERAWIGGGNSGRNTQVIRSNYFFPQSIALYDHALRLYEELGTELNFNIMFRQRGVVVLAHSAHELELQKRRANSLLMNGVRVRELTPSEVKQRVPGINVKSR